MLVSGWKGGEIEENAISVLKVAFVHTDSYST
jgi:hypothetical protein